MADATTDRSPIAHALAGALHTRRYLQLIGSTLRLLSAEMGEQTHPTAEQHAEWTEAASWLSSVVCKEADDLDGSLAPYDESQRQWLDGVGTRRPGMSRLAHPPAGARSWPLAGLGWPPNAGSPLQLPRHFTCGSAAEAHGGQSSRYEVRDCRGHRGLECCRSKKLSSVYQRASADARHYLPDCSFWIAANTLAFDPRRLVARRCQANHCGCIPSDSCLLHQHRRTNAKPDLYLVGTVYCFGKKCRAISWRYTTAQSNRTARFNLCLSSRMCCWITKPLGRNPAKQQRGTRRTGTKPAQAQADDGASSAYIRVQLPRNKCLRAVLLGTRTYRGFPDSPQCGDLWRIVEASLCSRPGKARSCRRATSSTSSSDGQGTVRWKKATPGKSVITSPLGCATSSPTLQVTPRRDQPWRLSHYIRPVSLIIDASHRSPLLRSAQGRTMHSATSSHHAKTPRRRSGSTCR